MSLTQNFLSTLLPIIGIIFVIDIGIVAGFYWHYRHKLSKQGNMLRVIVVLGIVNSLIVGYYGLQLQQEHGPYSLAEKQCQAIGASYDPSDNKCHFSDGRACAICATLNAEICSVPYGEWCCFKKMNCVRLPEVID